jgi:Zn-dependent protease
MEFFQNLLPLIAQGSGFDRSDRIVPSLIVIFLAIGIHEYCHAKFADMAGDPTPRIHGRVTLNLFNHFDPIGAMFIVLTVIAGFGIGWGRPVPMDPSKMRNPKWDHFAAVAAGPVSNLVQAMVFAGLFQLVVGGGLSRDPFILNLLVTGVIINLALFFFNLIPLGPLDGMWILGTFLPDSTRDKWTYWNLRTGMFVFLGILMIGWVLPGFSPISILIGTPTLFVARMLGLPL